MPLFATLSLMKIDTYKIDRIYNLGIRDGGILRLRYDLVSLNSGAWIIFRFRCAAIVCFMFSPISLYFGILPPLIFLAFGAWALFSSSLFYRDLVWIHCLRVAAGREGFISGEGGEVFRLYKGLPQVSMPNRVIRGIAIGVSYVAIMLLFGLLSDACPSCIIKR